MSDSDDERRAIMEAARDIAATMTFDPDEAISLSGMK